MLILVHVPQFAKFNRYFLLVACHLT